jgi:hypothetical protein
MMSKPKDRAYFDRFLPNYKGIAGSDPEIGETEIGEIEFACCALTLPSDALE